MTKRNGNHREMRGVLFFSFCGKAQDEGKKLVAGPAAFICDEGIELCKCIVEEKNAAPRTEGSKRGIPEPKDIKLFLDQYVISQERTKKVLSVAVYNHYSRLSSASKLDCVATQKRHISAL